MIYKMISSQSVIAKVIADLDLKEKDLRIADMREWIGEAMEKIGAVAQLDHRVKVVPINGYQAKMPCDLYRLNQVAYSSKEEGGWLPMIKSTGSFGAYTLKSKTSQEGMLIKDDAMIPIVKNVFNLIDDKDALDKINQNPNIRHTLGTLINQYTWGNNTSDATPFSYNLQYSIKPGYVYTNVPEGYLKLSYHAIHTDNEGMPMIPDLQSYTEAIYWYVVMKLSYPKFYKGQMSQAVYYDIRNSWNFYCKQAYAEAMMPNTDELQTVSNAWHTLVPEINDHSTFFDTTGDRQIIYNWN